MAFVAACLLAAVAATSKPATSIIVRFEKIREPFVYRMTVLSGGAKLWASVGSEHWAYVLPRRGWIVSGNGYDHIVRARTVGGRQVWHISTDFRDELECYTDVAIGGDTMLLVGRGPTFGISLQYVEVFADSLAAKAINAYDVRTGRVLWRTTARHVGFPLWTNGAVFVSKSYDASPRAVARYGRTGRPLREYLEEWSVLPRRCLWRKRLPGHVIEPATIRAVDSKHAAFRFVANVENSGGDSYLAAERTCTVVVPILKGNPPGDLDPRLFEVDGVY